MNKKKDNVFVQQEQWKLAYTAAARKRLMKWNIVAVQVGKREYTRPEASVESYNVERGFAASGAFESLGESGNSYNDSNFT